VAGMHVGIDVNGQYETTAERNSYGGTPKVGIYFGKPLNAVFLHGNEVELAEFARQINAAVASLEELKPGEHITVGQIELSDGAGDETTPTRCN
jgi:hypothetical protein